MVHFEISPITEGVTRIDGVFHERMYLVEGSRRAALIDSGFGFGSLRKVVESLTDKPVILLITHGHVDHAMGAGEFPEAYMNPEDLPIFSRHGEKDFRWDGLLGDASLATEAEFVPTVSPSWFRPLAEGDVFDLGGITLEAWACPGHTPGSTVFLDRKNRLLFTGDAFSDYTLLLGPKTLTVEAYAESLRRLQSKIGGAFDRVLEAHGTGELPPEVLPGVLQVCRDVMAGRSDRVPSKFRDLSGFLAKARKPHSLSRADGGIGNLVYREDKIWEGKL